MKSKRYRGHLAGPIAGKSVRVGIFIGVLLLTNVLRLPFLMSNRADVSAGPNKNADTSTSGDAARAQTLALASRDEDALSSKNVGTGNPTLSPRTDLAISTQSNAQDALLDQLVKSIESSDTDTEEQQPAETDGEKKTDDSPTASANPSEARELEEFDDEDYNDYPKQPFLADAPIFGGYHATTFDGVGFLSGNSSTMGALGSSGVGGGTGGPPVVSP